MNVEKTYISVFCFLLLTCVGVFLNIGNASMNLELTIPEVDYTEPSIEVKWNGKCFIDSWMSAFTEIIILTKNTKNRSIQYPCG